jgi:hypothetical protein
VAWGAMSGGSAFPNTRGLRLRPVCDANVLPPTVFPARRPAWPRTEAATRRATFAHVAPVTPTASNVATREAGASRGQTRRGRRGARRPLPITPNNVLTYPWLG